MKQLFKIIIVLFLFGISPLAFGLLKDYNLYIAIASFSFGFGTMFFLLLERGNRKERVKKSIFILIYFLIGTLIVLKFGTSYFLVIPLAIPLFIFLIIN
ncbi:hypothetical protein ACFSCX_21050 [Bacillus salitolerans]|uniref:DUF3953 domain-containing protein n=1 Tax=Bacillus salitolerans TaxID=1437434 RepID=A0ABW4LV56_9BACI